MITGRGLYIFQNDLMVPLFLSPVHWCLDDVRRGRQTDTQRRECLVSLLKCSILRRQDGSWTSKRLEQQPEHR